MISTISPNKFSIPCSVCSEDMFYTRKSYAAKRLKELAKCYKCRILSDKVCISCKVKKPITEFPSRGGSQKHLFDSRCKACKYSENVTWRQNNIEKVTEYRKKDIWNLKKRCARVNITEQEFLNKLEEQKNCCQICETTISIDTSAIDHNHITGEFRGVLCKTCNRALGMFRDSPKILENALDYLLLNGYYGPE